MNNLTLIIPAKEEKYSLPRVLDEVKDLNFKKLIVLAEDDFETREAVKNSDCKIYFKQEKVMKILFEKVSNMPQQNILEFFMLMDQQIQ